MQGGNGLNPFSQHNDNLRDVKSYPLIADFCPQYTKDFLNYKYSSSIGNININNYTFSFLKIENQSYRIFENSACLYQHPGVFPLLLKD